MDNFAAGSGSNTPQGGWNFFPPEVRLSLGGKDLTMRPGETARIGRSPDNDLVTDVPFVSRQHGVLREGPGGWEFENTGSSSTYLDGEQVTRVTVDRPLDLVLGSAEGPVLHVEPLALAEAAPPTVLRMAAPPPPPPPLATPLVPPQPAAFQPAWASREAPPPPVSPADELTGDGLATALRILFPFQSWLHDSGWRQGLRLLVIAYALLPLIFLALLSNSSDLK